MYNGTTLNIHVQDCLNTDVNCVYVWMRFIVLGGNGFSNYDQNYGYYGEQQQEASPSLYTTRMQGGGGGGSTSNTGGGQTRGGTSGYQSYNSHPL